MSNTALKIYPNSALLSPPALKLISCEPPLWAQSGHLQTILGHYIPSSKVLLPGEKEVIPLKDGDRLVAVVYPGSSDFVISAFHGISGDSNRGYMQRLALIGRRLGHSVVLVNHRRAGEGVTFAKKSYHPGGGEDISAVIQFLQKKFPEKKQIAVGFSMSGSMVLSVLTGLQGDSLPDGAIVINAPIDFEQALRSFDRGFNRVYGRRFARAMGRFVVGPEEVESRTLSRLQSHFVRFDDYMKAVVAKEGFSDLLQYYLSCSTHRFLERVATPTYALMSSDDPFTPLAAYQNASWSQAVSLHIERVGGHMGYLHRSQSEGSHRGLRWLDYYLEQALESLVKVIA